MRDRSTNAMMLSGPATGSGIRHPHDASCFSLTEATAIRDTIADTVYQDPPSRAQPWRTPTPSGTGMLDAIDGGPRVLPHAESP